MEIIVKVGNDEPEFWSQDFSESLLSSVEAALLALKQKKTDLQKSLFRLMDSKGSFICSGNEHGYVEQLSFFTRLRVRFRMHTVICRSFIYFLVGV